MNHKVVIANKLLQVIFAGFNKEPNSLDSKSAWQSIYLIYCIIYSIILRAL